MKIIDLITRVDFATSKTDARRKIKDNSIKISGVLVEDTEARLVIETIETDNGPKQCMLLVENMNENSCIITPLDINEAVISFGKKKHKRIVVST